MKQPHSHINDHQSILFHLQEYQKISFYIKKNYLYFYYR
jgi:hypothetical protein